MSKKLLSSLDDLQHGPHSTMEVKGKVKSAGLLAKESCTCDGLVTQVVGCVESQRALSWVQSDRPLRGPEPPVHAVCHVCVEGDCNFSGGSGGFEVRIRRFRTLPQLFFYRVALLDCTPIASGLAKHPIREKGLIHSALS